MSYVCSKSLWRNGLAASIQSFPKTNHVDIRDMGFPDDWEQHRFWKNNLKTLEVLEI